MQYASIQSSADKEELKKSFPYTTESEIVFIVQKRGLGADPLGTRVVKTVAYCCEDLFYPDILDIGIELT